MPRFPTLIPAVAIAITSVLLSCVNHDLGSSEPIGPCDAVGTVSFDDDIKPILEVSCIVPGCHNGSLGPDLFWGDVTKFKAHAAEASRRVQLPDTDPDQMPKEGTITSEEKQLIVCWVAQGANIDN